MIIESLIIGLVIGFLFYELVGVSPGGVIAPAYFAIYITQLNKIFVTIIIAIIVFLIIKYLSQRLIIYGRRRLLIALLIGFCLKLVIDLWIQPISILNLDIQSIGYIIPGLIANEMQRQKIIPTLGSIGIVTILIYLTLLLFQ